MPPTAAPSQVVAAAATHPVCSSSPPPPAPLAHGGSSSRFCAPCMAFFRTSLRRASILPLAEKRGGALSAVREGAGSAVPEPAAVWGATALVTGTTVGAGILALPTETAAAGLAPSLVALTVTWAASVFTGLLLAEVTASVSGSGEENAAPSFVSLARATLGPAGSTVALGAQFLLQYLLLIAYTSKGGEVLSRFLLLPPAAGAASFAAVLGLFVGTVSPAQLDAGNGALLGLLLVSFVLLLGDALPHVSPEALSAAHWSAVLPALPVISLAFVYHNVVPLTVRAVRGHAPSLRFALFWGTALPLVMYALWEIAILGQPELGMRDARAQAAVDAFSLLAVATSYLGFSLSLSDMLADLRRGEEAPRAAGVQSTPPGALLAALLPPLAAAVYFKDIFISALESAGLYGALLLGGILPGVMAISDRRRRRRAGEGGGVLSTPGGDVAAAAVAALAGSIILADVLGLLHD